MGQEQVNVLALHIKSFPVCICPNKCRHEVQWNG